MVGIFGPNRSWYVPTALNFTRRVCMYCQLYDAITNSTAHCQTLSELSHFNDIVPYDCSLERFLEYSLTLFLLGRDNFNSISRDKA